MQLVKQAFSRTFYKKDHSNHLIVNLENFYEKLKIDLLPL